MRALVVGETPIAAYYDRDWFSTPSMPNVAHQTIIIDEVDDPVNRTFCASLVVHIGRYDAQGRTRYYYSAGQWMERDGWVEAIDNPEDGGG